MAKKYVILKRFSYEDKDGIAHVVERHEKNEMGKTMTNDAGEPIHVVRELPREALEAAKRIKKLSGKPAIDEYDGDE